MASSHDSPPPSPPTKPNYPPATILLIYPATLILGSLFSVLSPTAQVTSQQQQQQQPINYFARKNNIFNIYFVKIGWIWLTLAFASILLVQILRTPSEFHSAAQRPRRLAQAGLRYVLVTLVWYFTTQWFFGPPIIDRSFVFTGGKCERILRHMSTSDPDEVAGMEEGRKVGLVLSAAACKAAGGAWRGGHDVSGHVFMLVLITAVLGFEAWGVMGDGHRNVECGRKKEDEEEDGGEVRTWALRFVGIVIGLSWWMLLMTGIWFHTWLEKLNGLLIALSTVYTLYILPRRVIPWKNVVGIPGV